AALDRRKDRQAAFLKRGKGLLHVLDDAVEICARRDARGAFCRRIRDLRLLEGADIEPRAEMWPGRGEDDHPRFRVLVDIADDPRQLAPEGGDHAVALLRPVQDDMGDFLVDLNVETAVAHGYLSLVVAARVIAAGVILRRAGASFKQLNACAKPFARSAKIGMIAKSIRV